MLKGKNDPQHNDKLLVTNCLGPALLYKMFLPVLSKTVATSPTATVRVTWAASIAIEVNVPPAGMDIDDTGKPKEQDELTSYGQSKTGNVFLARHYAKDTGQNGIVHVAFNPGNLRSNLQRHWSGLDITLMVRIPSIQSFFCNANPNLDAEKAAVLPSRVRRIHRALGCDSPRHYT